MAGGAYDINDLQALVGTKANSADLGTAAYLDTGSGSANVLTKAIADSIYQPIGGEVTFPFFTFEDFGAVGDGVANDRTAIVNCLIAAAGRKIYLKSGSKYRITSTITHTGSVNLETLGAIPAEIYSPTNAIGNLLNITNNGSTTFDSANNWKTSKTLQSSMTIGLNGWLLNNTTDVAVGDLLQVVSSQLYYGDNRGTIRKSELHVIHRVDGNTIYTESGAFESYDTSTETVTIGILDPIRVSIKRVGFKSTPNNTTTGMARGVRFWGVKDLLVEDSYVDGFSNLNMWLSACYRATVRGGYFANANDTSATGYGVQTYGCTHTIIEGSRFWNNRRGVDISGSPYVSRNTLVKGCMVLGNSSQLTTEGTGWWPSINGAIVEDSFGYGCHSSSDSVHWVECVAYNVAYPFVKRGRNSYIKDCVVYGDCRFIVGNSYCDGLFIDGLIYNDGFGDVANGEVYISGLAKNNRYPIALVGLNQLHENPDNEQIEIKNCRVTVARSLLWTTTLVNQPNNVLLKNNHVVIRPEVGYSGDIGYLCHTDILSGSNSGPRSGWSVSGNTYKLASGANNRVRDYFNITLANDIKQELTTTHTVTLSDNTATSFPVPFANSSCRVMVDCQGSASGCIQLVQGANESRPWGTTTNLNANTLVLSGNTGLDNSLNVSLVNNVIYLENRLGGTKKIVITILHGV